MRNPQKVFQEAMIDFHYSWFDPYKKYAPLIEFSFTHYHWVLALKILDDKALNII